MNILSMIRERQLKERRLHEAKFLMAKTYRGVAYVNAEQCSVRSKDANLTYRGISYAG
jgi:hypothetical protein